ncbi:MAG: bifunctional folylpolyglutamate synthase/dihydrofolate synthase [Candidatus Hydrogenedentes bacterium]|nr:bifunctional folylpolyglutamate synthase/dihydrofolate synthase [Candidatus Hydrogenedentota bacterium]
MNPRDYLASLEFHGIKLGLDNIRFLMSAAGDPHLRYPVVHVAGTNGKGSVVAMLASVLQAAGYRVGRFTSPHLLDLEERFVLDRTPVAADELNEQLAYFQVLAQEMSHPPTYFELCTAVAFRWFAEKAVDVAVVEVGMGGRFDSTNVVEPVACAITNIDLEHMQYLGATVEAIAFEKAGIIKPRVPVVVAEQQPAPLRVIQERADANGSPVSRLGRDFHFQLRGEDPFSQALDFDGATWQIADAPLALAGRYQGENAATALALAEVLESAFPRLNEDVARAGLSAARWPCRMEKVMDSPPVILDVAHNPAGMRRLAAELKQCFAVLAVSSDKDAAAMIRELDGIAHDLILTRYKGRRAADISELEAAAAGRPHRCFETLEPAIFAGIAAASVECPLVVTGSIFTAGQARRILMERYGAAPLQF